MAIKLLDAHTAELIAAGEVVERPASVVKELVENAIDAGAATVVVSIEQGGIKRIQVEDDGGGIARDELSTAFMRHATSKVRTQQDLVAIGTLGFRGEALASIASVSRVELLTKTADAKDASLYQIEGSKEIGQRPAARADGTTFIVSDLFYNTPARMKFLKKDVSEGTFVGETMTRLALSHPAISFRFSRDGKEIFHTPGDGQLQSAIYAVLGASFARDLVAVQGSNAPYHVEGWVTSPLHARASRSMQYFFVNDRFVKNTTMMAALEQAYRGTTMKGRFPGGVLFLSMPAELVDVNVHPAKTEIRFANERAVFGVVYQSVKEAVQQTSATPSMTTQSAAKPAAEAAQRTEKTPTAAGQTGVPPAAAPPPPPTETPPPRDVSPVRLEGDGQTLAANRSAIVYEKQQDESALDIVPQETAPAPQQTSLLPTDENRLRIAGELFETYIVAQNDTHCCLIDKHAAHERILYEELLAQRTKPDAQQLLAPVTVTLGAAEKNALIENAALIQDIGFDVEDFGGSAVAIRAVPADVEVRSVESLITDMAHRMAINPGDTTDEKTEWILHSMACRAAVKAGDRLPTEAMLQLAEDIVKGDITPFCPHGRPVVMELSKKELEKRFGRLG